MKWFNALMKNWGLNTPKLVKQRVTVTYYEMTPKEDMTAFQLWECIKLLDLQRFYRVHCKSVENLEREMADAYNKMPENSRRHLTPTPTETDYHTYE